jgi:hypothetical protein
MVTRRRVSVVLRERGYRRCDLGGRRVFEITETDTLDSLIRRSKAAAAELVLDVLNRIESDTIVREPLNLASGSYYSWTDRNAVRRFRTAGRRL